MCSSDLVTAAIGALAVALVIGIPTDVIPNPVFGRPVPVTAWSYPVLVATAVLGGLLLGTYVNEHGRFSTAAAPDLDAPAKRGSIGAALSYFAVGCPVCNKIVLIALGTSGALAWFAPVQPFLALLSVGLLGWALIARLAAVPTCAIPAQSSSGVMHSS